jgi:histidinol phosphatase-like PHP family hydrolase
MLCEAGVALTTASDAHQPDQLGDHFADVRDALDAHGVATLTTFERRHRRTRAVG